MRLAVCLHGGAVTEAIRPLHPTDRRAISLARALGETVVLEAVSERGCPPSAATEALGAGARRAMRVVDPVLGSLDAHATGFVLASALHRLEVDMVLFGGDADPEGLGDVAARVAHHMGAFYVADAIGLQPCTPPKPDTLRVTVRGGAWLRDIDLPLNAVVGVAPFAGLDRVPSPASLPATQATLIDVVSVEDFKIEPADLRRANDLRGVAAAVTRPLVTLHAAEALAELLRRPF